MAQSDFDRMMCGEQIVEYKGVKMRKSEYDKMRRKEKKTEMVKRRNAKIIPTLPKYIKEFTRHFKLCKSLVAYYNNGYRQWGVIVKEVTENSHISYPFIAFVNSCKEIEKNLAIIEKIAKRNDRDVFGYIEKLHYAIDDTRNNLNNLTKGIFESGILNDPTFKGKEFIYGTGRRLGIRELCSRTLQTMFIMNNTIQELQKICERGIDVMEYDADTKKTITFVTCG